MRPREFIAGREVASERINQHYQAVTLGLNYKLN